MKQARERHWRVYEIILPPGVDGAGKPVYSIKELADEVNRISEAGHQSIGALCSCDSRTIPCQVQEVIDKHRKERASHA